jgi:HEAT repeat protein
MRATARSRTAAVRSLGWSGNAGDVAAIARALRDSDEGVRRAAAASLAELGGSEAADALAAETARVGDLELLDVVDALAWLHDERARRLARRESSATCTTDSSARSTSCRRSSASAMRPIARGWLRPRSSSLSAPPARTQTPPRRGVVSFHSPVGTPRP